MTAVRFCVYPIALSRSLSYGIKSFFIFAFAIVLAIGAPGCTPQKKPRIVATLPAISSLLCDLTSGTGIIIQNAIPPDVSIAELDQFITEHGKLLDSLSLCDAVFDLRSVVRQDVFYPQLRKRNIRIVEVDCATPPDPVLSPIPILLNGANEPNPFVWLSVSNAVKMAEIAAKDLASLYPHFSGRIFENLADLKRRYFALKASAEGELAQIADFRATVLTPDFDYFLNDVNLFVPYRYSGDDNEWTVKEKNEFSDNVRRGRIRTLVHRWKPTGASAAICDSAHVDVAVLAVGDPAMKFFDKGLFGLIQKNYALLQDAFLQKASKGQHE